MDNFLLRLRRYENSYKFVLRVMFAYFILLLFLALLGMLWVMASVILRPEIGADFMGYAGYMHEKDKPEFIKLIGLGISGIIATFGVIGLLWRAASLDEQNTISKKGQVYERFKTAIEHVGNKNNILARIAAFNEFYHAAEIEPELRKIIFNLLCAHLRQTTKDEYYKNNIKSTEEVQSLLDILFKPKNKNILIFSGLEANLAEANLQGANLQGTNLQDANLQGANLQGANLQKANLQDANLQKANLQGANLDGTNLQKANLQKANLQEANLDGTNLQKANLQEANLQEANLDGTNLQGADLQEACLQDANLRDANLRDANLQGADLMGARINIKTTVMPDNWNDVVKLYEKNGEKKPLVVVTNSKGEVIGRI